MLSHCYVKLANQKSLKTLIEKKSSAKIKKSKTTGVTKPPSPPPPPIKVPTPPPSEPPQPIPPVAPSSPPKLASLANNMYPMPKALPTRPVCSDEGR